MNILLVLIPVTLLLIGTAGFAFFWAVDHDQFDDMRTPELLPLLDIQEPPPASAQENSDSPPP
jgi:cbb3-type cytochrome oxidase maturation protein